MIVFEDLTIDYVENLPLLYKVECEKQITNFIERFSYIPFNKKLNIPKKPKVKRFRNDLKEKRGGKYG